MIFHRDNEIIDVESSSIHEDFSLIESTKPNQGMQFVDCATQSILFPVSSVLINKQTAEAASFHRLFFPYRTSASRTDCRISEGYLSICDMYYLCTRSPSVLAAPLTSQQRCRNPPPLMADSNNDNMLTQFLSASGNTVATSTDSPQIEFALNFTIPVNIGTFFREPFPFP